MKLQKLTIHNIASIENATLDFCSWPLATEPLFLISGETGAGKTTLLDCISLALYKKTPRLGNEKSNSEVANIGINDCRQLLRRGTVEGYTLLDFEGNDERHYHARWGARRARGKIDGNILATWSLVCEETKKELCKDSDINPQIEAVVGLSFSQFSRTTMLAQGDFTQFLKSDGDEKALLLEKLTGTEIFSRIGSKIYELSKKAEETYSRKKTAIDAYQLLNDDARNNLQIHLDTQKELLDKVKQEKEHVDLQRKWVETDRNLNLQQEKLKQEYSNAKSLLDSDNFKQYRQMVDDWNRTSEVRQQLELLHKAQTDLQQQKADIATQQIQFERLTGGIKYVKLQLENISKQHAELSEQIAAEEQNRVLYNTADIIAGQIDIYQQKIVSIKQNEEELSTTTTKIKETEALQGPAKIKYEEALHMEEEAQLKVEHLRTENNNFDIEALNRAVDSDTLLLNNLKAIGNNLTAVKNQQQSCTDIDLLLKEGANRQKNLNATKQTANSALTTAKEALRECEQRYSGAKEMGEDALKLLRSKLSLGSLCPLCGQEITALHSNEELDALYQKYTNAIADAEKEITRCQEAYTAAANAVSNQEGAMKQLADTQEKQAQALATAQNTLTTACRNAGIECEMPQLEQLLSDVSQQALKQQTANIDARNKANSSIKQLTQAQEEHQKKVKATQVEKEQVGNLAQQMEKLKIFQAEIKKSIDALKQEADNALREVKKPLADNTLIDVSQIEVFKKDLLEKADNFLKAEKKCKELENAIGRGKDFISNLNDQYKQLQAIFNWQEPALAQPQEIKDITSIQNQMLLDTGTLKAKQNITIQAIDNYNCAIDRFCKDNNIGKEYIVNLMNHTNSGNIKDISNQLEQAAKTLSESKGSLNTNANEIAEHLKHRPTDLSNEATIEELQALIDALDKQMETLNQEIGSITSTLTTDTQRRQQVQLEQAELQALENTRNNWNRLNKIFGDANGKTFRNIAESFVLQSMLVAANAHLIRFTNRYQLSCHHGSMVLEMIDKDMGQSVRPVNTLSGGESFIVSLALALALSNLNQNKNSVDTLFIDEGFGTLSEDILDVVVSALEVLHQNGGHRVGIISHMSKLSERISTQIQVKSIDGNRSSVNVIGR